MILIKTYNDFLEKLNEGVLNTYPIIKLKYSLNRILLHKYKKIKSEIDNNILYYEINEKISKNSIDVIHNECLRCGYFISNIQYSYINDDNINTLIYDYDSALLLDLNNMNYIFFQIERNKDGASYLYNGALYHVTTFEKLKKILKIGLCPKSGNKISAHPDRIYLFDIFSDAENFILKLKEYDKIEQLYVIINLKINKLLVYPDPNSSGVYTTNNISPDSIDSICDENSKQIKIK